jgi:tRNA(Ile)-lysidine synthase TilS/MesJ
MKCLHCGRKAVYELRYSGHWVCERHFIDLFERRVKKTIRQGGLLDKDDTVLVGLSKGRSSLVALKVLNDILRMNPNAKLLAATVDTGLPKKDVKVLKDYCRMLGVEHHLLIPEMSKVPKGGHVGRGTMDLKGGDCLYVFGILEDFAKDIGAKKLATGENLDFEITMAFVDILSGNAGEVFGGKINPGDKHTKSVPRIKVLRECLEDEVIVYAKLMNLPLVNERQPSCRGEYQGTAKKLLDSLEENHPGSKYQMLRSVDEFASMGKELLDSQRM